MSYKITSDERLEIFSTTLDRLGEALSGTSILIRVVDSSDQPYLQESLRLWKKTGLNVHHEAVQDSFVRGCQRAIASIQTPYFFLQFDDFVTLGLDAEFLTAACRLMEEFAPHITVVRPIWPLDVSVSHSTRTLTIVCDQQQPGKKRYQVRKELKVEPLFTVSIDEFVFGIFENFGYGFAWSPLVGATDDYLQRADWYIANVSSRSVHMIETAAADRTLGPYWKHIAVCLSRPVVSLDLDFAHTPDTIRPDDPHSLDIQKALSGGYDISIVPLPMRPAVPSG